MKAAPAGGRFFFAYSVGMEIKGYLSSLIVDELGKNSILYISVYLED